MFQATKDITVKVSDVIAGARAMVGQKGRTTNASRNVSLYNSPGHTGPFASPANSSYENS